ncbi:hypothetical protein T03_11292 [Trichinella britovi]|uniref:Uncharacterized protein n=3 Tax=Trichinella TaxID=6333 RepID=A0A0V1CIK5_TRIBR|nr:hypothetical protein T05_7531 [Trichinella murrelli]KRY16891.1 hypothetical protein T12_8384 [Trichinella patagoniensis]KRY48846.1 hypothetical protein T03_11292 [Trichinella britovi]KRZ88843.1 hypothetical protein T08_233 [Trichinella sp. T8]
MRPMSVGKCISEDGSQRPGPVVTACSAGGYRLKAAGCNGLPSVRPHQAGNLNGCFLRLVEQHRKIGPTSVSIEHANNSSQAALAV